ncbi:MAG: aminodeoxychorismate/anthranilate synthase component II [Proteobacteria bacterium]|nr:aminodeoxychorismate/anthranilate synthase component II [Pseudomonadota bacterium]MDA1310881.1 aminodeoxychorismate/anthranilate synthase component II [Pseudomonadota bacterium]
MKAVLVDAYDSFVHIIHQYLLELEIETTVIRRDKAIEALIEQEKPDFLVLGPGPGHPRDAGYLRLLESQAGKLPILGVCLGHQAIGMAYGGQVRQAANLMHGKSSPIRHDGLGCFKHQPDPFQATRYHSLIVDDVDPAGPLTITARAEDDGYIMGLRHRTLAIESVQFHPESITTTSGANLLRDFVATYVR